jgi:hypothetical protein
MTMLGDVLRDLTDPATAEAALSAVADPALQGRVRAAAAEAGVPVAGYVAAQVRHVLDHGDEAMWVTLLGRMAASPQPGVAALHTILASLQPAGASVPITAPLSQRRDNS